MKERIARQLCPDTHQALRLARRVCGKEPLIKSTNALPHGTRAVLRHPSVHYRPYEIIYRRGEEKVLDHLIAHEIGHIIRFHRVPESERLMAIVTPESQARAIHQLIPNMVELIRRGIPEDVLPSLINERYEALCQQLVNGPADIRIEQWIYDRFPGLRAVQRQSLTWEVERNEPLFTPEVIDVTPPTTYFAQMAMNAAQAYHVSELTDNSTLLEPFQQRALAPIGEMLARMVLDAPDHGHRSDMEATNKWAEELGLSGWFEWHPYDPR